MNALPPPLYVVSAPAATVSQRPALPRAWTPGTPAGTWDPARLPITFVLAGPDPRDLGPRAELELELALRAWPEVSCTSWRATYGGRVATAAAADDGVNEIIWHDDAGPSELDPGVLAQTVIHLDATGHVHDADIHVNGHDFRWSTDGAAGTADARGVLTHELGHALGLGHSADAAATMFASRSDTIAWRSLEKDDVAGVCALYPGAGAARCDESAGAPCPAGSACLAHVCFAPRDRAEVCSPCSREPGACAAAGDDARCIDLTGGRVCGRACAADADCGAGLHCKPTSTSGDLQCVADDACARGPFPCTNDDDCASLAPLAAACRSGACLALVPEPDGGADAGPVEDASDASDAGGATVPGGGCACSSASFTAVDARPSARYDAITMVLLLAALRRRRRRAIVAFAPLLVGCNMHASTTSAPARSAATTSTGGGGGACADVVRKIESTGARHPRPELTTWVFDVTLANPAADTRWLVFPEMFARDGKETPFPGKGPILALSADLLAGRGRVVALHATGEGGFRAIEVPAHGQVVLNELPVNSMWTSEHKTARLDVIVARQITIDADPVARIVNGELLSDGDGADVSASADPRDKLPLTRFFGVPRVGEAVLHPVVIDEECRSYGQAVLKDQEP